MTFARFMELALYDPEEGYYASGRARIGREGDFYTSVSVGRMFAAAICEHVVALWRAEGSAQEFFFHEHGAHDGTFCEDFLGWAKRVHPDFFEALRYRIVEPFAAQESRQRARLGGWEGKVTWLPEPQEEDTAVFHYANEVLDALPVHMVEKSANDGVWKEIRVAEQDERFVFQGGHELDEELMLAVSRLPEGLPEGYRTEIPTGMEAWLNQLGGKVKRGWLLFSDYGFAAEDYYAPWRGAGHVQYYRGHRKVPDAFEELGKTDISVHVSFSDAARVLEACGFEVAGFCDQNHFLTGACHGLLLRQEKDGVMNPADLRALKTLMHPESMGAVFHFLGFARGVKGRGKEAGFRFQSPRRLESLRRRLGKDASIG